MTTQESFKKRIRARMAKTGEKYGAARRALLPAGESPGWVHEPPHSDAVIRRRTGRGWDDWRQIIDAWPGRADGHAAIARHLVADHGVDEWWAQGVTVGYERITGKRAANQRGDGSFEASVSRTLTGDLQWLRVALLEDSAREDLLGGMASELRSKATSKAIRVGVESTVVQFAFYPVKDRVRLTVTHTRLPGAEEVTAWKGYWGDWLDAIVEEWGQAPDTQD